MIPAANEAYNRWLERADKATREEMEAMSETEIEDSFYRDLAFGTGGLRGVIGAGPNRMNQYTISKATQGLANYLNSLYDNPSVAIARDSRNRGEEFCRVAASVLAANGIRVMLYPRIEPTPSLSFAVRHLHCSAGICITASHNPAEYNGYKVYGSDGCQITTAAAKAIQAAIDDIDAFEGVLSKPFESGIDDGSICWIGDDVIDSYIDAVAAQGTRASCDDISVVYTPLHGAGLECAMKIFERIGVSSVTVEPHQAVANGDFPTCHYPNPELPEAMKLGLELCNEVAPDLLIASDPDADRMGIAVAHDGEYRLLLGNEVGILLVDYLCSQVETSGGSLEDAIVVTTIVSSDMATPLAIDRGFELRRTLTGFKYIGEQIGILESKGESERFLFGFEESYGYLRGDYVRDKDAIVACMLVCEMAQWHKSQGRDLVDALASLYGKYGFYKNKLISISYPGAQGAKKMASIMADIRDNPPVQLCGANVESVVDYLEESPMPIVGGHDSERQFLPSANVIEFNLANGCKLIIRPSGTEPKIKAYLFASSSTDDGAESRLCELESACRALLNS